MFCKNAVHFLEFEKEEKGKNWLLQTLFKMQLNNCVETGDEVRLLECVLWVPRCSQNATIVSTENDVRVGTSTSITHLEFCQVTAAEGERCAEGLLFTLGSQQRSSRATLVNAAAVVRFPSELPAQRALTLLISHGRS